ncbi:MAG TPA: ribonuclease P protein component [Macromonas sp.]|nr:ribonuclease P protein component [Macromonas sp.]
MTTQQFVPIQRANRLERIRHRTQFDVVLAGYPLVKTPHFALHMADTSAHADPHGVFPGGGLWLGVLIPKRWARRAVTRNALRRQIYAVARELAPGLPPQGLVVRLRSGFSKTEFLSATSEVLKRAARAELLLLLGDPRLAQRAAAVAGGAHA